MFQSALLDLLFIDSLLHLAILLVVCININIHIDIMTAPQKYLYWWVTMLRSTWVDYLTQFPTVNPPYRKLAFCYCCPADHSATSSVYTSGTLLTPTGSLVSVKLIGSISPFFPWSLWVRIAEIWQNKIGSNWQHRVQGLSYFLSCVMNNYHTRQRSSPNDQKSLLLPTLAVTTRWCNMPHEAHRDCFDQGWANLLTDGQKWDLKFELKWTKALQQGVCLWSPTVFSYFTFLWLTHY